MKVLAVQYDITMHFNVNYLLSSVFKKKDTDVTFRSVEMLEMEKDIKLIET